MMIETEAKVVFNNPLSEYSPKKDSIILDFSDFWIKRTELRERYPLKQVSGDPMMDERCDISANEFLGLVGHSREEGYRKIKERGIDCSEVEIAERYLRHDRTREFFYQLEKHDNTIRKVTLSIIELW